MFKAKDRSPLNNAGQQMMASAPRESTAEGKKPNFAEFQQKIEELMNELRAKDTLIGAVQRNYEGMSKQLKDEKEKSLEWNDKIAMMDR